MGNLQTVKRNFFQSLYCNVSTNFRRPAVKLFLRLSCDIDEISTNRIIRNL